MSHYDALGITRDATEAEIKKAYRALVKEFHPDTGNPGDVARFHAIQRAYEVLSDAVRRRAYDDGASPPVSWIGGFEEPLAPFREVRPPAAPRPRGPVHLDIVLSPEEADRGGDVVLEARNERSCERCGGGGLDFFGWCSDCRGEGWLQSRERVRFRLRRGIDHGTIVTATASDGSVLKARVRIR